MRCYFQFGLFVLTVIRVAAGYLHSTGTLAVRRAKELGIAQIMGIPAALRRSFLSVSVAKAAAPIVVLIFVFGSSGMRTALAVDLENGEEINELCAGCHGEFGEGGKHGEYPRLSGQPTAYLERQLHLFRDRARTNLAMVEYIDERQMPNGDITDVSAYLAAIELPTRLPPIEGEFDALERLQQAKRVLNIALAPGDLKKGRKLYRRECRPCHGKGGKGRADKGVPMLAGQYTAYLWKQTKRFLSRKRVHDPDDPSEVLLVDFEREEIRDIYAWLSTADD